MAEALGDFDNDILRERIDAERRAAAKRPSALEEAVAKAESGTGTAAQRPAPTKGPLGAPTPPPPPAPDTPDARDEDVVARQLREAAEKETDPELKELLWKEYERYVSAG